MIRRMVAIGLVWLLVGGCAAGASQTSGSQAAQCPDGRNSERPCPAITVWAKDPDTGACCRYKNPCAPPVAWKTFPTKEACERADK